MITFETKLFFENVGKISTAMGRTILKYIYPWSVLLLRSGGFRP